MKMSQKKRARMVFGGEKPILCPPDRASRSLAVRIFGFFCRLLVIFVTVLGFSSYILTAFYPALDTYACLWTALVSSLVIALACHHPLLALSGGVLSIAGMALWLLSKTDALASYLKLMVLTGYNAALDRLYARGFYSMVLYRAEGGDGPEWLLSDLSVFVTLIVALLFVPFLARRARLAFPATVSVLCLFPLFLYNVPPTNTAIMLLIAGFAGTLIMAAHDRMYGRGVTERGYEESTLLFVDDRPSLPEDMPDRAAMARERRREKEERRQQKQSAKLKTVEEELTDYFESSKKKVKRTQSDRMNEKNDATRRRERERRRQIARVRRYDRTVAESRSAMGGVAGAVVTVIALLLLAIPAATVSGPFSTIDAIDRRVEAYREYVTAKLRGDDPVLDLYTYLEAIEDAEPHSTTAKTQVFDEIRLVHVGSQYGSELYMPNFIGVDYADGAWQYFSDEQYFAWRERYGVEDAPAETTYADFIEMMAPDLIGDDVDWVDKFSANRDYGFAAYMVNTRRLRAMGSDALLPRVWNANMGILEYQTTERRELPFATAFDGIFTGHLFDDAELSYSVLAYAPIQTNPEWIDNVAAMIASYEAARDEIERYENSRAKYNFVPDYSLIDPRFTNYAKLYIEDSNTIERQRLTAQMEAIDAYTDFVYDTYLDSADSDIVRAFADRVVSESGIDAQMAAERSSWGSETYKSRHLLTMAVIDTLVLEKTYSRTITQAADPTLDGVENFLDVMDEGYCVQFASTAALTLRELGIPVRYVEGYLATDYQYNIGSTGLDRYTTYVRDSNAHAWIEVWYDGIGWIVYETTPVYYTDMYGTSSSTAGRLPSTDGDSSSGSPETPKTPVTPPEEQEPGLPVTTPDDKVDESGVDVAAILRTLGIVLAVLVPVAVLAWLIGRTVLGAKHAERARQELALRAAQGGFANEDERRATARALIRQTMALLSLYGTPPERGELKDDYARRLSFAYERVLGYPAEYADEGDTEHEVVSHIRLAELFDAMAAEEFGGGMSEQDMKRLSELYLTLRAAVHLFIPAHRRAYLHYIKRML